MLLAFVAMFMMFGFVGGMDCGTISVEKGFIGAVSCLLWFSALMYLAGGFRVSKKTREECKNGLDERHDTEAEIASRKDAACQ